MARVASAPQAVNFCHNMTKASAHSPMRKYYIKILKDYFYQNIIQTRSELKLTQEQMAETLAMDVRSFSKLNHGTNSCSALTLSLYLIYYCEDVPKFLSELKAEFESEDNYIA